MPRLPAILRPPVRLIQPQGPQINHQPPNGLVVSPSAGAQIITDPAAPQTPVSNSLDFPIEAVAAASAQTVDLPVESVQGVARALALPVDLAGALAATSRKPIEALRLVTQQSVSEVGASAYGGAAASVVSPVSPGSPWLNPGRAVGPPDGSYATATLISGSPTFGGSDFLVVTGYGFSIPSRAIAFQVTLRGLSTTGTGDAVAASFTLDGTLAHGVGASRIANPTATPTDYVLGGPADAWSISAGIAASDVNGATFGLLINAGIGSVSPAVISLDAVELTVYYLDGVPIEALGAVASPSSDPVESAAAATPVLQSLVFAIESLSGISFGLALPAEATDGVTATGTVPLEAASAAASTATVPVEATKAVAATENGPLEAQASVAAAAAAVPVETTGGISASATLAVEALGAIAQTATQWLEAAQAIVRSAVDAVESALGLSTSSTAPVEAAGTVTATAAPPVEASGAAASAAQSPVEALGAVSATAEDPVESTAVGSTPVSQTGILAVESTAAVQSSAQEPLDAAGVAASSAPQPVESVQPVSTQSVSPVEALAGLSAQQATLPLDVLGALLQTGELPFEAIGFVPIPPPPIEDGGTGGTLGDVGGPSHSQPLGRGRRIDDDEELIRVLDLLDLL